ncbi:MAG: N-acetyltransferase [Deltaproteobacteria bacterium]|nr:N-acetyltransferase [Deltaproteobacteria bacterium]
MTQIEIAEGVAELPRDEWNALVGEESPFLEWDWLASLEESGCVGSGTGWLPRPMLLRRDGRLVGACPLYVKTDSEGEFVFDWGWADAALRAGIAYYPKLLVGVPFTPVAGARLLAAPGEERASIQDALAAGLRELSDQNDFSGVHVNFCRDDELETLRAAGYLPRVGFQYHWINHGYATFEDYLERFRSKRRNQIRRERRELARHGIHIEALCGDEIGDELLEPLHLFYSATVRRHSWGREYLNRAFFELLLERYRDRLVLLIARQGGVPIAGSINVAKGDTLYGRYWGCLQPVRHLHFNVCYYAAVDHCIERGLQRFEPGAGGDYKQVRGFDAQPTLSAHYLADPRLAQAVAQYLERERDEAATTIEWLQERSALKKPQTAP